MLLLVFVVVGVGLLGGFGVLLGFLNGLVLDWVGWGFGGAVGALLFLNGLLTGRRISSSGLGRHNIACCVDGIRCCDFGGRWRFVLRCRAV